MHKLLNCMLSGLLCLAAGCSCEEQVALPPEPLCGVGLSKEHAMQLAEDVLVDMRFEIAKMDLSQGVMTTRPMRGSQFFEFWRSDNADVCRLAESNLHSVVRRVTLIFSEDSNGICVDSNVEQQRLVISDRPIPSMSRLAGLYTGGNTSLQKLAVRESNTAWEQLPDDVALSNKILNCIEAKIITVEGKD